MYSTATATTPIAARVSGETYDVHEGNNRIPEITSVPYLDVVAALNDTGDTLTVFAVNRHQNRDIPASLRLAGFVPAKQGRVQTLSGTSLYQVNDELRPNAVVPVESAITNADAAFEYLFPHASVTVFELRRKP